MSVKVDHSTKGDTNDIAPYTLTLRNTQRVADGAISITQDSVEKNLTWLDTVDNLPASS